MKKCLSLLAVIAAGCALRVGLLRSNAVRTTLAARFEFSTPVSAFRRLAEGAALQNLDSLTTYAGPSVHHPPLLVWALSRVPGQPNWPDIVAAVLVIADVFTAFALRRIARWLTQAQQRTDASLVDPKWFPDVVAALWLFSPLSIASTVALCTDGLVSVFVVSSLLGVALASPMLSGLSIAIAAYLGFYPAALLAPLCCFYHTRKDIAKMLLVFIAGIATLLFASWMVQNGSWSWVQQVYLFQVWAPERTPNIGLWWYFFLEQFEHFETFFTIVFQAFAWIYALPIALRFRKQPLVAFWGVCAVAAMFTPYPSAAHIALHFALLPLAWSRIRSARWMPALATTALALVVLMPFATYTWLYTGTGNVNFYYFSTMALQVLQLLFVTDCLAEVAKREFLEDHGFIKQ